MNEPKIPLRPDGPHPAADSLYRAIAAERSGAATAEDGRIFSHLAGCALCSAEVAHLEGFDHPTPLAPAAVEAAWGRFRQGAGGDREAAPPMAPMAPTAPTTPHREATLVPFPSRPATSRPRRQTLWAAAAMLAVGLGLGFFLGTSNVQTLQMNPPTPLGHPPPDGTRGGTEATGPAAPTGELDRIPTEIRFANPNREPKRVLLFATDPPYQWQSPETTGNRIELPAAERAKLRPNVSYFWSVIDADGESAAQTFRLRDR